MATTLPQYAAHLRIHRSLELHLFDADGRLLSALPLRDQLYSIGLKDRGGLPEFCVEEARTDDSQGYKVHLPISLPHPDGAYYDPDDGLPLSRSATWYFQAGFGRDTETGRTGTLVGIGTVDIADISILPIPAARIGGFGGWLSRIWRCLFPPKVQPVPKQGLFGIPSNFPVSASFQIRVWLNCSLPADPEVEGASSIRLGAFWGKETVDGPEQAYLMICANPALVTLEAQPLFSGK